LLPILSDLYMRSKIVAGGAAPRDEGATPGEVSAALTLIAPTGDAASGVVTVIVWLSGTV
jgi:hypothetical protein